ncbi:MAG: peptidylprolyl isomerase [Candidatus Mariimomonas ferrooxydans]
MQAKKGDRIKVHYTLKLKDGKTVESSRDSKPMECTLDTGEIIPGFENGVIGMAPGESKTVNVPVEDAYGLHNENKIFEFGRERAPQGFEPRMGEIVSMHRPDGNSFSATVIGITEKNFKMDANHPLAGKDLVFDLELVEIVK